MELLESQDPDKKKLIETSARHKRELEKEVNEISAKTQKIVTNALIIGGSLALSYFIVSRLTSGASRSQKKKVRQAVPAPQSEEAEDDEREEKSAFSGIIAPALIAQIGTQVVNQVTLMLLGMAREKLNEYLHSGKEKDENS